MELECPHCATGVPAWRMSASGIALCGSCHTVFERSAAPATDAGVWRRPKSITVEELSTGSSGAGYREPARGPEGRALKITRRWRTSNAWMLFAFTVVWDGGLTAAYGTALGAPNMDPLRLICPIFHVGAGILMTYMTVAFMFNRTTIVLDASNLHVDHGPISMRPFSIKAVEVEARTEICVEERIVSAGEGGRQTKYALVAHGTGAPIDLISWHVMWAQNEVEYVAHALKSRLASSEDSTPR